MKTLTTTFHFVHNYGAVLQTYALQQFLLKCGYENLVIDYRYYEQKLFRKLHYPKNKSDIKCYLDDLAILSHYHGYKERFDRFEYFIANYIKKTEPVSTIEEVETISTDAYITGSDQVWNLSNGIICPYDLPFKCDRTKISYAASMGNINQICNDSETLNRFIDELQQYKSISVREVEAKDFLEQHGIQNIEVHVDPVFLLSVEDWKQIIREPIIREPYILCYQLLNNQYVNPLLRKLTNEIGSSVISLCPSGINRVRVGKNIYNAGPLEFLNYIYYADKVVTTSFHGTAFSVLFHKDFYSLNNQASPGRISNLLNSLGSGLQERLLQTADTIPHNRIDYLEIDAEIRRQQQRTQDYFEKSLKK